MKRAVTNFKTFYNPGSEKHWAVGGSTTLTLECGHTKPIKNSRKVPAITFCPECASLANGAVHTKFDREGLVATVETWNSEAHQPLVILRPMTPQEIEEWC